MIAWILESKGMGINFSYCGIKKTTFSEAVKFADEESAKKVRDYIKHVAKNNLILEVTEHIWE